MNREVFRADKALLVQALKNAGAKFRGDSCSCAFHDDGEPSAGVYFADGAWHFKCHAASCGKNGDVFDVIYWHTGKSVAEQLRELSEPKEPEVRTWATVEAWHASHQPGVVDRYEYVNPDTRRPDLLKLRIEGGGKKRFVQAHIGPDGRVIGKAPGKPYPIFNRSEIRTAEQVIVVEGEKCVKAIRGTGFVATCAPTGGRKGGASECDWTPLAGKVVILWPDQDAPDASGTRGGHRHMLEVAEQLKGLNCVLWWLDPERLGLGEKQDAHDYLAKFDPSARADAMSDAVDLAVPMDGLGGVEKHLEEIIAGKWSNESLPDFLTLSRAARPLLPGCVWVIIGDPGSTKSMLGVQVLRNLVLGNGTSAAAYMLEDDVNFHLLRALAQLANNSNLTDDEWIREHPEETRAAFAKHRGALAKLESSISVAPDSLLTYDDLLKWSEAKMKGGARVVYIDPISGVNAGDKQWETDKDLMTRLKSQLRKYGASAIIVTHPKNGTNKRSMFDAAGSQAFGRFAHCITWLSAYADAKQVTLKTPHGEEQRCIDRELIVNKCRNGRANGKTIGMNFSPRSLTFHELGFVTKAKQKMEDGGVE